MARRKTYRNGEIFTHKLYGKYTIVDYIDAKNVIIKFDTGYRAATTYDKIKNGCGFRDNFQTSKAMIGDKSTLIMPSDNMEAAYNLWMGMLCRCSNIKNNQIHKCYEDVTCGDDFLTFVDFARWCQSQVGFMREDYQLDKDILKKGNRIYTAEYCCFVPKYINTLLLSTKSKRGAFPIGVSKQGNGYTVKVSRPKTGEKNYIGYFKDYTDAFIAYKKSKEKYINDVANIYRNDIDERVYDALCNYSIDLCD